MLSGRAAWTVRGKRGRGSNRFVSRESRESPGIPLKAQVDVCIARNKKPDDVFCRSWVQEGAELSNSVAIVDMPRWDIGHLDKQTLNRAMRIASHVPRITLLPGDWFAVTGMTQNWIYLGNDRYFGHGVEENFGMTADIGPISEVEAKGRIRTERRVIDAGHFATLMAPEEEEEE